MPQAQAHSASTIAPPSGLACIAIVVAYLLLVTAGMALLRTRGAMPAGSELSVPRTVFTIANAASLTGFQQAVAVESYKPLGQMTVLGMMIAGSLMSMIVGAAAVVRLLRLPYSMTQIVLWALGVEAVAVALGAALLVGNDRNGFQAIFQAASALGNCGVVVGPVTPMRDLTFHLLILPLSVIGGLGLPVLMELCDWIRLVRPPSLHTRVVLVMSAGLYLVGFVVLAALLRPLEIPKDSTLAAEASEVVMKSSTAALNSRTLGWSVDSPATWSRAAVWFVMILMMVGASPAGTGGGVKTTTLFTLTRGTWRILRGRAVSRIFGIAMIWVLAYLALVLLTTMYLLSTQPQLPADQVLFISISAASNVGLSHAPVSITGGGLFGISVTMMLGRLLPLLVLWWAAMTVNDADVAVG